MLAVAVAKCKFRHRFADLGPRFLLIGLLRENGRGDDGDTENRERAMNKKPHEQSSWRPFGRAGSEFADAVRLPHRT